MHCDAVAFGDGGETLLVIVGHGVPRAFDHLAYRSVAGSQWCVRPIVDRDVG